MRMHLFFAFTSGARHILVMTMTAAAATPVRHRRVPQACQPLCNSASLPITTSKQKFIASNSRSQGKQVSCRIANSFSKQSRISEIQNQETAYCGLAATAPRTLPSTRGATKYRMVTVMERQHMTHNAAINLR